jgi:ubiquitin-protein ligase
MIIFKTIVMVSFTESPLVESIASEYLSDRARFNEKARQMTRKFSV